MSDLDRLSQYNYTPTTSDVLHSQIRSSGIFELILQVGGQRIAVVDAAGSRTDRRKWGYIFDPKMRIMFVVGLSGYDRCLYEDHSTVGISVTGPGCEDSPLDLE